LKVRAYLHGGMAYNNNNNNNNDDDDDDDDNNNDNNAIYIAGMHGVIRRIIKVQVEVFDMSRGAHARENSNSIVTGIVRVCKKNGFVPKLFATGKVGANKAKTYFLGRIRARRWPCIDKQ